MKNQIAITGSFVTIITLATIAGVVILLSQKFSPVVAVPSQSLTTLVPSSFSKIEVPAKQKTITMENETNTPASTEEVIGTPMPEETSAPEGTPTEEESTETKEEETTTDEAPADTQGDVGNQNPS